jgi:tripartite-type tricarboxylate transporter receptor subunit TctC
MPAIVCGGDMQSLRLKLIALMLAAGALWGSPAALSQDYPARSVRIVTSTPGNFHDIVARQIAHALALRWSQPVIVENRGGGGATIAATAVAQAAPDGYTLLVTDRTALAVQPSLNRNLAYQPSRDLAPVSLVASSPMILVAHSSVPATSLGEFVAYIRQSSTPVEFASAGPATGPHLMGEVMKQSAGANVVNVHYKGSPAAMMGLLGGETKAAFILVPVGMPHIAAGKVKAYAISGRTRFAGAPAIPTVAELGMPELESELWLALMAPAKTPPSIVAKVNHDVVEIIRTPEFRQAMLKQGAEPMHSTPEELAHYMRTETARWRKVIEAAGVRID